MVYRVLTYPTIIFSTTDEAKASWILKEKYGFRGGFKVCSDLSLEEHTVDVRQALEFGFESKLLISDRKKDKEKMKRKKVVGL